MRGRKHRDTAAAEQKKYAHNPRGLFIRNRSVSYCRQLLDNNAKIIKAVKKLTNKCLLVNFFLTLISINKILFFSISVR